CLLLPRGPRRSPPFPYTTLFRSEGTIGTTHAFVLQWLVTVVSADHLAQGVVAVDELVLQCGRDVQQNQPGAAIPKIVVQHPGPFLTAGAGRQQGRHLEQPEHAYWTAAGGRHQIAADG